MAQHQARKRFGQNFLHDQEVISRLVRSIAPRPGQRLVEIGPGQGALTRPLIDATDHLHAVELDRDLIARLRQTLSPQRLTLHEGDALRFDFRPLADGPRSLRIVGNLPYNISTPLLFHLLEQVDVIHDMHFMLQKEMVERLVARPGTADWGRLSVMIQYHCQADLLFLVPPGAFRPAPKVDSAIVRLVPHATLPYPAKDPQAFGKLVNLAFTQRRKAIRNGLKSLLTVDQIQAAGVDPGERPDRLRLEDYVRLANLAAEQPVATA